MGDAVRVISSILERTVVAEVMVVVAVAIDGEMVVVEEEGPRRIFGGEMNAWEAGIPDSKALK